MTSEMAFECLLVSADPSVWVALSPLLQDFSITTHVCRDTSQVASCLNEGTTDLFVVDADVVGSTDSIRTIRGTHRHQKPTILALSASAKHIPGADFQLRKPITRESGLHLLRTAYSRMVRDFRKHTRFAIMHHTLAKDQNDVPISVIVTNIGEGGVGLSSPRKLTIGSIVSFETELPGLETKIHVRARILWTRDYGAAGAEFVYLAPFDLHLLHAWLDSRYRLKKPLIHVENPSRDGAIRH